MSQRDRIFVYGTLRKGQPNHGALNGCRLLGTCQTPPRYRLLDLGVFPGAVCAGSTAVTGEVYEVTPATLRHCDAIEGYPRLYTRERVGTPYGTAWMYLLRAVPRRVTEIPSGDWLSPRGACP